MNDAQQSDLPRRLLVVNPNTNRHVTALIRTLALDLVTPDVSIDVVNPEEGPISIETPADRALAEPKVIEIVRRASDAGVQGFVLACFDDIGVAAARRLAPGPVVDACEAGIAAARCLVDRFSIVTTVAPAVARIEQLAARYGAATICSVRAAGIGVAAAASGAGEEKLNEAIADAIKDDGAEAIVLGSGGLSGQADALSRRFGVPVIDGVAAAIAFCTAILKLASSASGDARLNVRARRSDLSRQSPLRSSS